MGMLGWYSMYLHIWKCKHREFLETQSLAYLHYSQFRCILTNVSLTYEHHLSWYPKGGNIIVNLCSLKVTSK